VSEWEWRIPKIEKSTEMENGKITFPTLVRSTLDTLPIFSVRYFFVFATLVPFYLPAFEQCERAKICGIFNFYFSVKLNFFLAQISFSACCCLLASASVSAKINFDNVKRFQRESPLLG